MIPGRETLSMIAQFIVKGRQLSVFRKCPLSKTYSSVRCCNESTVVIDQGTLKGTGEALPTEEQICCKFFFKCWNNLQSNVLFILEWMKFKVTEKQRTQQVIE